MVNHSIYAGSAKLFTQAIYERLDPELSEVDSHEQVLAVAQELDIITTAQYDVLRGEDQEAKITTIAELTTDNASLISGLKEYQNMPELLAYTSNSDGVLNTVTPVTDEDSAETLLLLEKGLASILNTQDKTVDRAVAILTAKN